MSGGAPDEPKSGSAEAVLNRLWRHRWQVQGGAGERGLNHTANAEASDADTTVALSRDTLSNLILKRTTLDKAIAAGEVKVSGDGEQRKEVLSHLDNLEFWFNIVTR